MSCNAELPHVLVIPEDDANRQVANGFQLRLDPERGRRLQVLPPVGGWRKVLRTFQRDHMADMRRYPERMVVLLVDFDGDSNRLGNFQENIPLDLADRVFVLGAFGEPEDLKRARLGTYEEIGRAMAEECRADAYGIWDCEQLRHNKAELGRLRERARAILFLAFEGARTGVGVRAWYDRSCEREFWV